MRNLHAARLLFGCQIGYAKAIGVFLNGDEIPTPGSKGERIKDDSFLLFFNAHWELIEFTLPAELKDQTWAAVINTKKPGFVTEEILFTGNKTVPVTGRSLVVLRRIVKQKQLQGLQGQGLQGQGRICA